MIMDLITYQHSGAYFIQVQSIQKKGFKIHSSFKHKLHSVENKRKSASKLHHHQIKWRQNKKRISTFMKRCDHKTTILKSKRFLCLSVNLKNYSKSHKGSTYSVRHIYQKFSSSGEVSKLGKREFLFPYPVWNKKHSTLFHRKRQGERKDKLNQKTNFIVRFTVVIS